MKKPTCQYSHFGENRKVVTRPPFFFVGGVVD